MMSVWPSIVISVHPRPRGEHGPTGSRMWRKFGSSPPARGTRRRLAGPRHLQRFIPARAGNTSASMRSLAIPAVHPRPRREHGFPSSRAGVAVGSSPPARGTLAQRLGVVTFVRFIPARAGNTSPRWSARLPTTVHPRPRGEHASCAVSTWAKPGSSPPARGTLACVLVSYHMVRFIPARAGNTKMS